MMDPKEKTAREALERLADFLHEEPPSDEEVQQACRGVDLDAMAARIRARVAVHEATLAEAPAAPPPPTLRDPEMSRGLPFPARKPNGRLVLAAGLLAALAAGAGAVVIHSGAAPRERDRGIGRETAGTLRAIDEPPILPDAGATVTPPAPRPPR